MSFGLFGASLPAVGGRSVPPALAPLRGATPCGRPPGGGGPGGGPGGGLGSICRCFCLYWRSRVDLLVVPDVLSDNSLRSELEEFSLGATSCGGYSARGAMLWPREVSSLGAPGLAKQHNALPNTRAEGLHDQTSCTSAASSPPLYSSQYAAESSQTAQKEGALQLRGKTVARRSHRPVG